MLKRQPITGFQLLLFYGIMALPACGILLLIASLFFSATNYLRPSGWSILFLGWISFSVMYAGYSESNRPWFVKFIYLLIFFPIIYAVGVVLLPWTDQLRHSTNYDQETKQK